MKLLQKTFLILIGMLFAVQVQATMFWARPYDPSLQRWITRDPIGERGGVNLYAFVFNAPSHFVDPFGLDNYTGPNNAPPHLVITSLGDTAAGRALAQSTADVPWSQARPQWLNLSENFSRSASGEVNVFQNARGVAADSIWRNEYQILRQNNVQINFDVVMPNGSVTPVP